MEEERLGNTATDMWTSKGTVASHINSCTYEGMDSFVKVGIALDVSVVGFVRADNDRRLVDTIGGFDIVVNHHRHQAASLLPGCSKDVFGKPWIQRRDRLLLLGCIFSW